MSYRMIYDIHTHTTFSHGKGSIEDNVKAAAEKGLSAIGIADHGPGHVSYGVKRENFAVMRREIQRLRPLYPQMEILLGVEANIMNPDGSLDVTETEKVQLDYVLAGYHYGVFGQAKVRALAIHGSNLLHLPAARKANTRRVVRALRENEIKILTRCV